MGKLTKKYLLTNVYLAPFKEYSMTLNKRVDLNNRVDGKNHTAKFMVNKEI